MQGNQHYAEQLKGIDVPVILVINKTDTVKREEILTFIDAYRKIYDFNEIIPASALRGQNTDTVCIEEIFKYLPGRILCTMMKIQLQTSQ